MKNLAGDKTCNKQIRKELKEAGIPIVRDRKLFKYEVPASIAGSLGGFYFTRAWYYWMVSGDVPLRVADNLYRGPVGKRDIRVVGHCGCPPPNEWAVWRDPKTGRKIFGMKQKAELEDYLKSDSEIMKKIAEEGLRDYDFAENPSLVGEGFITSYHIDSQEGLNKFVRTIKAYGLVKV